MPSILTDAGRALLAAKLAAEEVLTISEVRIGDPDVGGSAPETPDAGMTTQDDVVHTAALTASQHINPDQVDLVVVLDTEVGPFTITQVGYWHIEGMVETLVAVTNIAPFHKVATAEDIAGNLWGNHLVVKYAEAAEGFGATISEDAWPATIGPRMGSLETRARTALRNLMGRFAALNGGALVAAIAPTQLDALNSAVGWVASSGVTSADASDKQEGTASLKLTGQSNNATLTFTLGGAADWSSHNGLLFHAYNTGGLATNITFFAEDSDGHRSRWDFACQAAWAEVLLDAAAPTGNNGAYADLSDVLKYGWEGLDNAVDYRFDDLRGCRLNDFAIGAGVVLLEGLSWDGAATTYVKQHTDWDAPGSAAALAPPGGGTRTDHVYLDVWFDGDFNTKRVFAQVTVDDDPLNDYEDDNGVQHYVELLADILRTTSKRITSGMITDQRRLVSYPEEGTIQGMIATAIANLIDSSPGTLDTLNELAAALGDDPNFATTITAALALKAPLASPALTGNPTAPTQGASDDSTKIATTAHVKAQKGIASGIASLDADALLAQGFGRLRLKQATQTLSATLNLTNVSAGVINFDCNGVDRLINLPATEDAVDTIRVFRNVGAANIGRLQASNGDFLSEIHPSSFIVVQSDSTTPTTAANYKCISASGYTKEFLANGTMEVPLGCRRGLLDGWGGGGAGGGCTNLNGDGGGGGNSGTHLILELDLVPLATHAVTIGPGGVGANDAVGGVGTATTVGAIFSASGGTGGPRRVASAAPVTNADSSWGDLKTNVLSYRHSTGGRAATDTSGADAEDGGGNIEGPTGPVNGGTSPQEAAGGAAGYGPGGNAGTGGLGGNSAAANSAAGGGGGGSRSGSTARKGGDGGSGRFKVTFRR